jgi:hypothetical protein
MRRLTVIGLVAVTALAALALVGPASAAAKRTVLCRINASVCPKEQTYGSGAELTGYVGWAGTSMKFELPKVTSISCEAGKFGTVLKEVAEAPMSGEVDRWPFFTPCTPSGCTILTSPAEAPMGYAAELEATGGGDGVLRVKNPFLIARCIKAPLSFECKYSVATAEYQVEGGGEKEGEHAYITGAVPMTLKSGTGCLSGTASFQAHYQVYEPGNSVYVTN